MKFPIVAAGVVLLTAVLTGCTATTGGVSRPTGQKLELTAALPGAWTLNQPEGSIVDYSQRLVFGADGKVLFLAENREGESLKKIRLLYGIVKGKTIRLLLYNHEGADARFGQLLSGTELEVEASIVGNQLIIEPLRGPYAYLGGVYTRSG